MDRELAKFIALRESHQRVISRNTERTPHRKVASFPREPNNTALTSLAENTIHQGSAPVLLKQIEEASVALSVWSPPYFVGKKYEAHLDFEGWQNLLCSVIREHTRVLKPGGFAVINIADILCFGDALMPKIQAEVLNGRRSPVTREQILDVMQSCPNANRRQIASILGCSEQTVDRRLNGNNIRGGKYETQTRVKIIGGLIEEWALKAGLYPYDRRIWAKDPAWENSRWASSSFRAVDEFEYLYFLWKPGVTKVDRGRLSPDEWREWGARGVWHFSSVRANDDHEAKFPLELPRRVIRLLTDPDELVLDCFMGSGTTAIAAVQEGRRFIGIELQANYVELGTRAVGKMLRFPNADGTKRTSSGSATLGGDREGLNAIGRAGSPRL